MASPASQTAIMVKGLRKSYGDKKVLDGIDLRVAEGTIFALLGPNGAGKTTMVNILSTLIRADSGEAWVGGHSAVREPDAVRGLIGVTGQFSAVDNLLTGVENLRLMADLLDLNPPRAGAGSPDSSTSSTSSRRLANRLPRTPVACASGSTWR